MPSPFFPNSLIQQAWDATSLSWLKECPRKYQYSMIEGWMSRDQSPHLTFGIIYHESLELYDQRRALGDSHVDALREAVRHALKASYGWRSDHNAKNRENLLRSIVWYLEQYATDGVTTMVLSNGKPAIELNFAFEVTKEVVFCGRLDRVVQFADNPYVLDRKTTGTTLGPGYFDRFEPNNQMSMYTLAARTIYQTPVRGVIIDAAQVAVGFTRFDRGIIYRTEAQLDEWMNDSLGWIEQSYRYAERKYWPQNDQACFLCQFKRVCAKDPSVRDRFLEADFIRRQWNPLERAA